MQLFLDLAITQNRRGASSIYMSKATLDLAHESILDKGLDYCRIPPNVDSLQLHNDNKAFCRCMELKVHISKKNRKLELTVQMKIFSQDVLTWITVRALEISKLKTATSNFTWARLPMTSPTFTISRRRSADNHTSDEWHALRSLRNNWDIIIKPADNSKVIMDRDFYTAKGDRQLSDTMTYESVNKDPKCHLE